MKTAKWKKQQRVDLLGPRGRWLGALLADVIGAWAVHTCLYDADKLAVTHVPTGARAANLDNNGNGHRRARTLAAFLAQLPRDPVTWTAEQRMEANRACLRAKGLPEGLAKGEFCELTAREALGIRAKRKPKKVAT